MVFVDHAFVQGLHADGHRVEEGDESASERGWVRMGIGSCVNYNAISAFSRSVARLFKKIYYFTILNLIKEEKLCSTLYIFKISNSFAKNKICCLIMGVRTNGQD